MASGLSNRVSAIEDALVLLNHFYDRLRYIQPTIGALLDSACATGQLASAPYLTDCRDRMRRGESFPRSWRGGVEGYSATLGREESQLLASLGDILGATDLDSQLTAISYTREQLEHRLDAARQDKQKHGKLYRTLGVLSGMAIVLILV